MRRSPHVHGRGIPLRCHALLRVPLVLPAEKQRALGAHVAEPRRLRRGVERGAGAPAHLSLCGSCRLHEVERRKNATTHCSRRPPIHQHVGPRRRRFSGRAGVGRAAGVAFAVRRRRVPRSRRRSSGLFDAAAEPGDDPRAALEAHDRRLERQPVALLRGAQVRSPKAPRAPRGGRTRPLAAAPGHKGALGTSRGRDARGARGVCALLQGERQRGGFGRIASRLGHRARALARDGWGRAAEAFVLDGGGFCRF
mmetsp:Transcript_4189/g.13082  ORF Transcript_4189/g.13082 Transcript_4189/m.13082 type:complete len:253 (-) Transcript_4189:165-923(-)